MLCNSNIFVKNTILYFFIGISVCQLHSSLHYCRHPLLLEHPERGAGNVEPHEQVEYFLVRSGNKKNSFTMSFNNPFLKNVLWYVLTIYQL